MQSYGLGESFKQEVLKVATAGEENDKGCWYTIELLTGNDTHTPQIVESVRIKRDFNGTFTDTIKIVFTILLDTYIRFIKPYKNNLRVRVTHDTPGAIHIDEYKMIVALEDSNISADIYKEDKDTLENSFTTIHTECVDESIIFLKQQNRGITLKDCTMEEAIATVIDESLNKVTGKFGISKEALDIVRPDNTRVYKHIVIPSYIKVIDLPIYLQEKLGGVYNGSINSYFYREGNTLKSCVFPLYRPNLLNSVKGKLIVMAAADIHTAAIDNTYAISGNDLKILVMQKNKLDDDNVEMLGKGGSIKGIDANTVRGRPVTISKDGVEVKRSSLFRNMKESSSDDLSEIINLKPTDNFYEPRSKILKNKMVKVLIDWEYSNARLLYPYMPVVYLEEDAGGIKMREGMVSGVDIFTDVKRKQETCTLALLITEKEATASKPIKLF